MTSCLLLKEELDPLMEEVEAGVIRVVKPTLRPHTQAMEVCL
jgi:hypothetical protein